jgi:hypothetical protein
MLHFYLRLCFLSLSIVPKIKNNSNELAELGSIFGWPVSGYLYLGSAIIGVIFDLEVQLSERKISLNR